MIHLRLIAAFLLVSASAVTGPSALAAETLAPGNAAPSFTYRLLNGHRLSPSELRGHPYMLWLVASWCPSCKTGSGVIADHIDFLRSHGVRIIELQLADDLGASGPGLQSFQKAVGARANSPNWYWGAADQTQTLALDSEGLPDIYYLVSANGTIAAVVSARGPATTWDTIEHFVTAAPKQ